VRARYFDRTPPYSVRRLRGLSVGHGLAVEPLLCLFRIFLTGKWSDLLQVLVRDNNVEQALRVLKRKLQREGVIREMKRRRFYEKPSARATREKTEAIRRARKLARKQAIQEGLIVAARKKRVVGTSKEAASRPNGLTGALSEGAP
jgi:small subunit ribosomal protein S21